MNKEERVKLVFETISKIAGFEIKPDKEFYVVGNGVKDVYKIDEDSNLYCKMPEGYFRPSGYSILPIFRGGYQLEEIKEPLLTEEGKDFLRYFKFEKLLITTVMRMYDEDDLLVSTTNLNNINVNFDKLERNRLIISTYISMYNKGNDGVYMRVNSISLSSINFTFDSLIKNMMYSREELGL